MSTSSTISTNANVITAILSKIATVTTTTESTTTTTVTITTRSNFCPLVHLCKVENNNNYNSNISSTNNSKINNKSENKIKNHIGKYETNDCYNNIINESGYRNGCSTASKVGSSCNCSSSSSSNGETLIPNINHENNSKNNLSSSHHNNSNKKNRKLLIRNNSNIRSCRSRNSGISNIFKLRPILCLVIHLNIYFYHITASSLTTVNTKDYLNMDRPNFEDVSPRNVSSVTDETAILKCRVKNKGNRTVSWMRKRDLHILTTNIYTYTGDQRFSVLHPANSDDWDLKIDYAQTRDSGIYECQVNTEPKINLAVVLEITAETDIKDKNSETQHYDAKAARAKILGSTEIHVKRDSTIALACSVNIHASSVSWYHGDSVVDFDSLRGGISLETEKTDIGTTSRLMLTRASLRDSGNYTCIPTGAIPASVRVHVLTGEQPAAMQTSEGILSRSRVTIVTLCLLSLATWNYLIISQTFSVWAYYNIKLKHQQLQQQYRQQQQQQKYTRTKKLKLISKNLIKQLQKQETKWTHKKHHMQQKVEVFAQRLLQQRNR